MAAPQRLLPPIDAADANTTRWAGLCGSPNGCVEGIGQLGPILLKRDQKRGFPLVVVVDGHLHYKHGDGDEGGEGCTKSKNFNNCHKVTFLRRLR